MAGGALAIGVSLVSNAFGSRNEGLPLDRAVVTTVGAISLGTVRN